MLRLDNDARNMRAIAKVTEFRQGSHPEAFGLADKNFHWHKNHFPYFGFIDVRMPDVSFMMFSGNDDLVAMTYFWHGDSSYERRSLEVWLELAADSKIVLDVGAFSGVYGLAAAIKNSTCRVFALEASRRTHGRLLLNIYANNLQNQVEAHCAAAFDEQKELRLLQFRQENVLGNGASLLDKGMPVTDGTEIVATVTLDSFCTSRNLVPDLVKIDVEGAEIQVLGGMRHLLSSCRPRILIEITPRAAPDAHKLLSDHGYSTQCIDDHTGAVSAFDGRLSRVSNILALPPQ